MRFLTGNQLKAILSDNDYLALVERAYRIYGEERNVASRPSMSTLLVPHEPPTYFGMKGTASRELGVAGCFFGAQFGDYYFLVTDNRTGTLRGMIEQAWSTKRRTATSAIAAIKAVARPDAKVATVVGAGIIGAEVVRLLAAHLPLEEIIVVSRTLEGAQRLVSKQNSQSSLTISALGSVEHAVRRADIIVTITLASAPVIAAGWMKPGAFLCCLGGVPEVEFSVLQTIDRLIVDEVDYALTRGSLAGWVSQGHIDPAALKSRVDADIGEISCGMKPGRRDGSERIMATIQGMAICDLVIADHALRIAERDNVGLDWPVARQLPPLDAGKLERASTSAGSGLRLDR